MVPPRPENGIALIHSPSIFKKNKFIPEGFQPSPAELGLAQEIFEANGISEEETDHGFRHLDAEGRAVLQTETWGETQQTIQLTYGEGEAMTEQAKLLTGPEAGKSLTREHPRTTAIIETRFSDADLGEVSGSFAAKVETLAGTVGSDGSLTERWANLEVTDQELIEKFSAIPLERRQAGNGGETYVILKGDLGGGFSIDVGERTILVECMKKLSITYATDGRPRRANFGTIAWTEKRRE